MDFETQFYIFLSIWPILAFIFILWARTWNSDKDNTIATN